MKLKLFEAGFRVRPNELHPDCSTIKFGILTLWRLDSDRDSAVKIACAVAVSLPYYVGSMIVGEVGETAALKDYQINTVPLARTIGMCLALQHWGHLCNEDETLKNWPYIIPPLEIP